MPASLLLGVMGPSNAGPTSRQTVVWAPTLPHVFMTLNMTGLGLGLPRTETVGVVVVNEG